MTTATTTQRARGGGQGSWLPNGRLVTTRILEQRKRWAQLVIVGLLSGGAVVIVQCVRLVLHATDPVRYGPAGGSSFFHLVAVQYLFGFAGAGVLGASVGSSDIGDGVFRTLVVTGRSRVALFLARIPAGLAILLPMVVVSYAFLAVVAAEAVPPANTGNPDLAAPSVDALWKVGLWLVVVNVSALVAGAGLSSVTGQRFSAMLLMVLLDFAVDPLALNSAGLHLVNVERLALGVPLGQLAPAALKASGGAASAVAPTSGSLPMPGWAAVLVVAGWIVGWTVLGARRMARRDA